MKHLPKPLMDMSDAEVSTLLGDPSKSLRIMSLGFEVDKRAGQCRNNMLADCIWYFFHGPNPKPVKNVLELVLSYYQDNPEAIVAMFGEELIENIQKELQH